MRRGGLLVPLAGLGLGLLSESVAFGWDQPLLWIPDLAVGLAWFGAAAVMWRPGRLGPTLLCAVAGALWFAGGLWPDSALLHRGPLVHLLACFPRLWPRSHTGRVGVALVYLSSFLVPVWQSEAANAVLAGGVLVVVAIERRVPGSRWVSGWLRGSRRPDRWIVWAAAAWSAAVLLGVGIRSGLGAHGVIPALLVYDAAVLAAALVLAWHASRDESALTDLVVELGESPSQPLRDALAGLLGDRGLQIAYWDAGREVYADACGAVVELPQREGPIRSTMVDHDDLPYAVVLHSRGALTDPSLVGALRRSLRLVAANAALNNAAQAQVDDVSESRRRLAVAATEERARLEQRLERGALGHLSDVHGRLQDQGWCRDENRERAVELLGHAVADLRELARGLYPADLHAGLGPALAGLCDQSPVGVALSVVAPRGPTEVEAAIYFTCSEGLANIVKHAGASRASITISATAAAVIAEVRDDGQGGVDLSAGSGLVGVRDRVEALGGVLSLSSGRGGTLLRAEIPWLGAASLANTTHHELRVR